MPPSRLRAYLQLLRVPNLFTVPGDPLCGYLLASGGVWDWRAVVPAMAISLCAYCFGLVLNDILDLPEDRRERPGRPLPSGAIPVGAARQLCGIFFVAALVGAGVMGESISDGLCLLLLSIAIYNFAAKKSAIFGPLFMGACRAMNVALGACAFGPHLQTRTLIAICSIGLYIMGVSILARTETRNPRIPPLIGKLIRALLFIQAGFCLWAGGTAGWVAAAVLLALWPLSRLVASQFYAS